MSILSGRNGKVSYSRLGTSPPTQLLSINGFRISLRTDFEEVTCFGDTNKVYIPGLADVSGTFSGFWNSASTIHIVAATKATTPGLLELEPNTTDPGNIFEGLAYIDMDLDCSLNAPKITGNFRAAGAWALPGSP